MDEVICNISAFRYHRIPPLVRALYPPMPSSFNDSNHLKRFGSPFIKNELKAPLHVLVTSRSHRSSPKNYKQHLFSSELPLASFEETEHGFLVTSPAATLFTLARTLDLYGLLKAMYEFCGSFSIYRPPCEIEREVARLERTGSLQPRTDFLWERVKDRNGKKTSLWKRPPLLSVHDLTSYALSVQGLRGSRLFLQAAQLVSGVTASPLEAQLSMLLGLPRTYGGYGLNTFSNNEKILLTPTARTISGKTHCYADLLFDQGNQARQLIVEAQGASIHGCDRAALSDAERATGLQSMGYNVVMATYEQLNDERRCDALAAIIHNELGIRQSAASARILERRKSLRESILSDWSELD